MKLGNRLKTVAECIKDQSSLIDVGCDHAYLPIYLVKKGLIKRALACDVAKGPLSIAKDNIAKEGISDRIVTKLSDGIRDIDVNGYSCLSICGMGGLNILKILSDSKYKLKEFDKIIISPQSDEEKLLEGLNDIELKVVDEKFVKDTGKYYHILILKTGINNGYFYGKYLNNNEYYYEYINNRIDKIGNIIKNLQNIPKKLDIEYKTLIMRREYYEGKRYNK